MPAVHVTGAVVPGQRYSACGLTLEADAPIGGLGAAARGAAVDVSVALHAGLPAPPADPSDRAWYVSPHLDAAGTPALVAASRPADGSRWLRYSEGAAFRIEPTGARVDVWWQAPLTEADAATYLLGPVLAFVMRLRGRVPLHASAVAIGGRAVLFAGDAGAGKSTTAGAFATLAFPVLSDDLVPVLEEAGGPCAAPGYPRLSLCADAAEALLGPEARLPRFSPTYEKRYLSLDGETFYPAPLPIGQVFVLSGAGPADQAPEFHGLGARHGLMALLRHTYGSYLIDKDMRAREFDVLARLATAVPVYELRLGTALVELKAHCARLAEWLQCPAAAGPPARVR